MSTLVHPATPAEIEQSLIELRDGAKRWVALRTSAKAELLMRVRECVYAQASRWADAAIEAKGLTGTPLAGEEWVSGPWALLYALNRYIRTLHDLAREGTPHLDPSRVHERADGQLTVDVFPNAFYDRLLLSGVRAQVWMQLGVTRENLKSTMAVWYKQSSPQPRVALVLGAGNIASIPPLDVLYKLIADGAVCILKMNPVNEYLGPIFEDALKPLVDAGYLRFAYGGAEVGKALCTHPLVDEIHITGSDRTFNAIVADGVTKPITAELGNVSPTIVVPGPWNEADFRFQAEQIVTQKLHNDGFNCIAAQVLVLPRDWDGTPKLLTQIETVMREAFDRPAYYPGAANRCEQLATGHETQHYGRTGEGYTPRTIVRIDAQSDDPNFEIEAFSSVLAVTTLPGDTASFLRDAVAFANDKLWGTLGANVVAHPVTITEYASEFDGALAALRYGCIAVNAWTGVGFLLTETPWGAYPGHTVDDVRSGIGVVHNSFLFDRSQKSIVYAPFAPFPRSVMGRYGPTLLPKPPWFVTNRLADKIGQALIDFEMHQTPMAATKVAMLAMRA